MVKHCICFRISVTLPGEGESLEIFFSGGGRIRSLLNVLGSALSFRLEFTFFVLTDLFLPIDLLKIHLYVESTNGF